MCIRDRRFLALVGGVLVADDGDAGSGQRFVVRVGVEVVAGGIEVAPIVDIDEIGAGERRGGGKDFGTAAIDAIDVETATPAEQRLRPESVLAVGCQDMQVDLGARIVPAEDDAQFAEMCIRDRPSRSAFFR